MSVSNQNTQESVTQMSSRLNLALLDKEQKEFSLKMADTIAEKFSKEVQPRIKAVKVIYVS